MCLVLTFQVCFVFVLFLFCDFVLCCAILCLMSCLMFGVDFSAVLLVLVLALVGGVGV